MRALGVHATACSMVVFSRPKGLVWPLIPEQLCFLTFCNVWWHLIFNVHGFRNNMMLRPLRKWLMQLLKPRLQWVPSLGSRPTTDPAIGTTILNGWIPKPLLLPRWQLLLLPLFSTSMTRLLLIQLTPGILLLQKGVNWDKATVKLSRMRLWTWAVVSGHECLLYADIATVLFDRSACLVDQGCHRLVRGGIGRASFVIQVTLCPASIWLVKLVQVP